jgi:hypothetical protein
MAVHTDPNAAVPASVLTPDSVETRLGMLRFFDGFPDEETVRKVYDNLDFQRAVQVFLTTVQAATLHTERATCRTFGPDNRTVLIPESLLDSRSLYTLGNAEVMYNVIWLDTRDGALVFEIPRNVLGFINDFWSRWVTDVGRPGPDRGAGGKYLLLPPDHTGEVPDGYTVLRSRTWGNKLLFRTFYEHGDLPPAIENAKAHFRVYPLVAAEGDRPEMTFVDVSGSLFSNVANSDVSLFHDVADVVHDEPLEAVDPETRGLLASIGIRKDAPFAPDERMQAILVEAAAVGNATSRAILYATRDRADYYYPDGAWKMGWIGGDPGFASDGVVDLDARTLYCFATQGVSPAMSLKMIGVGSQYAMAARDAAGCYLDGGKSYRLHLPPDAPVKEFWAVTVYDPQTRAMLPTEQVLPEVSSHMPGTVINADTSADVYFGPVPPPGHESNWIQTVPGKGWFAVMRLYSPLEPWFDKTWRPGEIEPIG